jgi:tRNA (guanine37-N1)-methyltransferase
MWRVSVLTLFPDIFPGPLGASLAGKALQAGVWSLDAVDIRTFAADKHRTVDDTPAGGGPGMVMKPDVLGRAIDATATDERPRLLLSPRGLPLTQARVETLARGVGVVLVCGRFEGVDERVIAARSIEEVSIGDYVLSGGEIAAMALIDACVRLLPGVMGAAASGAEESFADGLLEYPQYTRPQLWEGRPIPDVLLSGDHGRIAAWRRAEAERLTRERRPDLWVRHSGARAKSANPESTTSTVTMDSGPAASGRRGMTRDGKVTKPAR